MTDPRKLRPSQLCQLLNSTPLGEVITEARLKRQRTKAGLRIGHGNHVDLLRYVAWLVHERHQPSVPKNPTTALAAFDLDAAAEGAAVVGTKGDLTGGNTQQFTAKQQALIAALLTEPNHNAAANKAGVGKTTMYRWLQDPSFCNAYRQARRASVEKAIGQIQGAAGVAVQALVSIAQTGRREGDRVRAANALLEHAKRGLAEAAVLHGEGAPATAGPMGSADVVAQLSARLRQLEQADLPPAEKSRLIATLSDALLKAIGVDVLDKRLEALHAVLIARKEMP